MKAILTKFSVLMLFWLAGLGAYAQVNVSGKVLEKDGNQALPGATVFVKGTSTGTATTDDGSFSLQVEKSFPFTLVISSVGFANREIIINDESMAQNVEVVLGQTNPLLSEVVVSATRRDEKITESPATINIITAKDIENLPSFNPGELLSRQKGVDFVRSGVLGTGINVRGFNSTFNPKNLQLNDGRFSSLVATGLPMGALTPVIKEDIERIEIVLGPSSALYGPNAGNGIVNTITKDPRTSEGTTFALGAGDYEVFSARLRHAQVLNEKFALKINAEYTTGLEFGYTDSVYVVGNPLTFNPNFNPAQPVGANNNPTRGVAELDLDRRFKAIKGDVSLYYSPTKNSDIIVSYLGSQSSNLGVTNQGRNQIKDWQIHQLHARYVSPRVFAQVYHTWSRTDSTYNINQRTTNYYNSLNAALLTEGTITAAAETNARRNSYNNAVFNDHSARWNAEIQYNNIFSGYEVVTGAQLQRDMANSQGTYLLDADGEIVINQIGVYAQVAKSLGVAGLKAVVSARGDNHDIYGFNFVPKAALLRIGENGTWRITYGVGIAAPTILNLEGNLFGGLILGNKDGFTRSDGSTVAPLQVERTQTIELGYKGVLVPNKLVIDANAYYNISKNFISPITALFNLAAAPPVVVTQRGDRPITDFNPNGILFSYVNFGRVNTWGADIGLNYYLNDAINIAFNYSYFDYDLREDDPENDFNRNGTVDETDLLINTPRNKANLAVNFNTKKWFGSVLGRWVEEYNFYSGINIAARTNFELNWDGYAPVSNTPHRRSYNYGPLGGFVNVDASLGYRVNPNLSVSAQVSNIFNARVREFVASPFIDRLFGVEVRMHIPAGKKQ